MAGAAILFANLAALASNFPQSAMTNRMLSAPVVFAGDMLGLRAQWSMFSPSPESEAYGLAYRCSGSEPWRSWASVVRRNKVLGDPVVVSFRAWMWLDITRALRGLVALETAPCHEHQETPKLQECVKDATKAVARQPVMQLIKQHFNAFCRQQHAEPNVEVMLMRSMPLRYAERHRLLEARGKETRVVFPSETLAASTGEPFGGLGDAAPVPIPNTTSFEADAW